jgi:hypothetical protein
MGDDVLGPVDPMQVPRFAGPATFARLPTLDAVRKAEVAIVGVPFDSGVVYRPGARFGPSAIRAGSRMLRPFNAWTDAEPFARQVADAGDVACTPFGIEQAIGEIENAAKLIAEHASHVLALGGDHTIALPLLRAAQRASGLSRWSTSMPTSTRGTGTLAALDTRTALHSAAPRRKVCSTSSGRSMSELAGRSSQPRTCARTRSSASG